MGVEDVLGVREGVLLTDALAVTFGLPDGDGDAVADALSTADGEELALGDALQSSGTTVGRTHGSRGFTISSLRGTNFPLGAATASSNIVSLASSLTTASY